MKITALRSCGEADCPADTFQTRERQVRLTNRAARCKGSRTCASAQSLNLNLSIGHKNQRLARKESTPRYRAGIRRKTLRRHDLDRISTASARLAGGSLPFTPGCVRRARINMLW